MHVRFSTCIGVPIVCDTLNEVIGQIYDILLHPDTGAVEGFFVIGPSIPGTSFLASLDIVRWGTQVHIQYIDAIFPLDERIRLQPLRDDKRKVLHRGIQTESGKAMGTCKDIQFNTKSMKIEWLFPKKWWKWGIPIPVSSIIEVTQKHILIKDGAIAEPENTSTDPIAEVLDALPEIAGVPKTREGRQ